MARSRTTAEVEVRIGGEMGLHTRPAKTFVQTASNFDSEIHVRKDGPAVNGKSIMGLMSLMAPQGTVLTITAQGHDARQAVAALAGLFEEKFGDDQQQPRLWIGNVAAAGIAIGPAYRFERGRITVPVRTIEAGAVRMEIARLLKAIEDSSRQLDALREKLKGRRQAPGHILEAHQMILNDEQIVDATVAVIHDEKITAEAALSRVIDELQSVFEEVEDEYLQERVDDLGFVGQRILRNLTGTVAQSPKPPEGSVVIAHELSPADVIALQRAGAAGLAIDVGGRTSHTALMARAFELPTVVGLENLSREVVTGDRIVVDGLRGEVLLQPTVAEVEQYLRRGERHAHAEAELEKNRELPAVTKDGVSFDLLANIEFAEEVPMVLRHGGGGVGLYRTEYLFVGRDQAPSDEDHYRDAMAVLSQVGDRPVTFRTVDLGGEKAFEIFDHPPQANPALGLRGIRLAFQEEEVFRAQLRGLLRASGNHPQLRIMLPMISGVTELRRARAMLEECRAEVIKQGHRVNEKLQIGVMIEMPSAVFIADLLAKECDFFAIGSNDLIQFSLGIDRENELVSHLYHPLHPAILRAIRFVVRVARAEGITVSLCGEMAAEEMLAVVLVGLGVNALSMPAADLPRVKNVIRACSTIEAKELVEDLVKLPTIPDIERRVEEFMVPRFLAEPPATWEPLPRDPTS